jgi:hypothetical protein
MSPPEPPVPVGKQNDWFRRACRTLLLGLSTSLQWLERTVQLFRTTLLKCLPLATIAILFRGVPMFYWKATGHDLRLVVVPTDTVFWILSVISAVVTLFLSSAVMLQQRSTALGVPYGMPTALTLALQRLPVLVLTWVLACLSLAIAFSLLIAPGLFLLVCYLVLLPVVLFERNNPYTTLVRSVLLVRPHWWKVFALLIMATFLVLAGVLVAAFLIQVLATVVAGQGPLFEALLSAGFLAMGAILLVFLSALFLTLHSALASSSA